MTPKSPPWLMGGGAPSCREQLAPATCVAGVSDTCTALNAVRCKCGSLWLPRLKVQMRFECGWEWGGYTDDMDGHGNDSFPRCFARVRKGEAENWLKYSFRAPSKSNSRRF